VTSKGGLRDGIDHMEVVPVDLTNVAGVRSVLAEIRPECAIHLAWYTAPGRYWTAPANLDCVSMTLSLAQALADSGCRRLVATGTCAEYDWRHGYLSEDVTPCVPHTLYGAAKHGLRVILEEFCDLAKMEFAWVRFFYLYGPGEQKERLVPSVVLSLLNGLTAKCTHGEQIRDFLHVEDASSAVCAVANSAVTGPVNVASGQPIRIRTIVETIAHILQRSGNVELGSMPADPKEAPVLMADVRRLTEEVGWQQSLSLEKGLAQTCEWWRSRLDHG